MAGAQAGAGDWSRRPRMDLDDEDPAWECGLVGGQGPHTGVAAMPYDVYVAIGEYFLGSCAPQDVEAFAFHVTTWNLIARSVETEAEIRLAWMSHSEDAIRHFFSHPKADAEATMRFNHHIYCNPLRDAECPWLATVMHLMHTGWRGPLMFSSGAARRYADALWRACDESAPVADAMRRHHLTPPAACRCCYATTYATIAYATSSHACRCCYATTYATIAYATIACSLCLHRAPTASLRSCLHPYYVYATIACTLLPSHVCGVTPPQV